MSDGENQQNQGEHIEGHAIYITGSDEDDAHPVEYCNGDRLVDVVEIRHTVNSTGLTLF